MLFIQRFFDGDPMPAVIQALVVIFSICCHEFAHAWTALKQGDSTAADAGHLTLNPMKQMGVFSLVTLLILGISWGAVPVNPSRMKHKYSEMLVSFAGPAMNLLLFVGFTLAYVINLDFLHNPGLKLLTETGAILNVVLFVFNLLPMPPLDGWSVFGPWLRRYLNFNSEWVKGTTIFLVMLVVIFSKYLFVMGWVIFDVSAYLFQLLLVNGIGFHPGA